MKCYILVGILAFMVIESSSSSISNWNTQIKDEKNTQPLFGGRDYWSNNILSDYGLDNSIKNRFLNERLRQHYKMRNGKIFPFAPSQKALFTQNGNPIGNLENDIGSFNNDKEEKINYDSNAEVIDEDFDGIWSNAKWLN